MPQNQRLASGFAIDKAEMSSSSPGRIAVPSATMSRPAGSRMKPEEARPTQVACVQSTRRLHAGHLGRPRLLGLHPAAGRPRHRRRGDGDPARRRGAHLRLIDCEPRRQALVLGHVWSGAYIKLSRRVWGLSPLDSVITAALSHRWGLNHCFLSILKLQAINQKVRSGA